MLEKENEHNDPPTLSMFKFYKQPEELGRALPQETQPFRRRELCGVNVILRSQASKSLLRVN